MMKIKENVIFDIQDTSVKMYYNRQCVIFNTYNASNRHKFNEFRDTIKSSPKHKLNDINSIYGLARQYNVRGTSGQMITIHKNIAF